LPSTSPSQGDDRVGFIGASHLAGDRDRRQLVAFVVALELRVEDPVGAGGEIADQADDAVLDGLLKASWMAQTSAGASTVAAP
jgi:hypothetical protein